MVTRFSERYNCEKIQELQQIKGDAYDYYISGNEETDLFEKYSW